MIPRATWSPFLLLTLLIPATAGAQITGTKGPVIIVDADPAKAMAGRRLALLLGIGSFDDDRWPKLQFTDEDATALADGLRKNGGFEAAVLTNTTRDQFVASLKDLERQNVTAYDTVLIYVSTHGTLSRDLNGRMRQVLVFRDTGHDRPLDSGMDVRDLLESFESLPSRRKVLILATCYSGTGKSALSNAMKTYLDGVKGAVAPPLYEVSRATVVLSASAWGETAREHPKLQHDIYTHFLLKALDGYDPNGDGATSVTEAHDFARHQTYRFTGGQQRPTALMTIEGEDPIILAGRRVSDGNPMLVTYSPGFDGFQVLVDGQEKGELPGGIITEPGWHEVSVRRAKALPGEDREVMLRTVYLRPGDRLDLSVLYEQESPTQLELHLGAGVRPGTPRGSDIVPVASVEFLLRRQQFFLPWLDASWAAGLARGSDTLTLNQDELATQFWEAQTRLGLGTHLELGTVLVHFDAWGGGGYLTRVFDSDLYDGPRGGWFGVFATTVAFRWRMSHSWSLGAGVGGQYAVGTLSGLGGNTWLTLALSP